MAMQKTEGILNHVEAVRLEIIDKLKEKKHLKQFFTSAPLARFMASMMSYSQGRVRILDPGAGIGALFAACVERACSKNPPKSISVTAFEIDPFLSRHLKDSLARTEEYCSSLGVEFEGDVVRDDFLGSASGGRETFTHIIINPPYKKIRSGTDADNALKAAGIRSPNMYAAFISISHRLLADGGQMTFISPRSFCNGIYFSSFREHLLDSVSLRRIHLFDSRSALFSDDDVLQENVIMSAKKTLSRKDITISKSSGLSDPPARRSVKYADVTLLRDPLRFIHIVPHKSEQQISDRINGLECTLGDLGVEVSTGKVVDFRIRGELRFAPEGGTAPLVRPSNISNGTVRFPLEGRKHHNFIMAGHTTERLLLPAGNYVVVKRFTTKEERRRVVAAIWTKNRYGSEHVGFENRTNYFHSNGSGMDESLAKGLWAFLNSAAVDTYFRHYNGSTQVNATDLRYLRYPSKRQLRRLAGSASGSSRQEEIDSAVEEILAE